MNAIERIETELDEAVARAKSLVDGTDGRFFTVRPHPGSWSAAECLSHLSISTEMFLPVLTAALEEARTKGWLTESEPKMDLLGRVLRWFLEPPIHQKVKTTAPFVPKAIRARADALREFTTLQQRLREILDASRGLDLRRVKIVSPFDKRVRYNVYSAFLIVTAHQRRHLWQAEQAIDALSGKAA